MTGPDGLVVGVDISARMIEEARKRAERTPAIDFHVADASSLPFSADSFDAARADWLFQPLNTPEVVLGEMTRVTRPGGTVVASEPDWETLVIDAHDRRLTRTILNVVCDSHPHGWMGRRLPSLFRDAGL